MDIQNLEYWQLWVLLAAGLAILFAGYKIKKIGFFIAWFMIGFQAVNYLLPTLKDLVPAISDNPLWPTLLPIAGGLLLGLLGFTIEKICVAGICFGLAMIITVQYFGTELQTLAIGAVVGVLISALAVFMIKPAIIVATSLAGGYGVTLALLRLIPGIDAGTFYWPMIASISAAGAIVQFKTNRHK